VHTSTLTFAEGIFLGRLIRSLKDRHSMISGRLLQLRFEGLLKKSQSLLLVFVQENSHQFKCLFRAEM